MRAPAATRLPRSALRGFSFVPLVTPFAADGTVSETGARRLVQHVVGGGCQGLLAAGTTGEAASMRLAERVRLVRIVVAEARGRALVFGGIGDNCLDHSVELGEAYFRAGAHAVVAHLPSYYSLTAPDIERYFVALADRLAGPLYLYNIPQTTRLSIPLDVVERLSRHQRIAGIKDSEPDCARQEEIARRFAGRDDFAIFCGSIPFTGQSMAAGADGFVPSAGNLAPAATRQLMDRWMAGDAEGANRLQTRLATISSIYQQGRDLPRSLAALKGALEVLGIAERHMLPPLTPCTDAELKLFQELMAIEGLLP